MDAFGTDSKPVGFETSDSEVARRYGALEAIPSESLDYKGDRATVIAGFTHDGDPEPADYLKQVIATSNTADYLASQGIEPEIKLILADEQSRASQNEIERRREVLENFNNKYGDHDAEVVSQSDLSNNDHYQEIIEQSMNAVNDVPGFRTAVIEALPIETEELYEDELEGAMEYALRESATVVASGADIKIGPPKERQFDSLTRDEQFKQIAGIEDRNDLLSFITSPTIPACAGFSDGNGGRLQTDDYQQLKNQGGATPYKNSFTRVELQDSREDIQRKLELAPLEQQIDMSLIAEELERRNPTDQEELSGQLHEHFSRLSSSSDNEEMTAKSSIYSYGGDI